MAKASHPMELPPFKMLPSRRAVLTCDDKFVVSGRASYVWETFLLRRVAGVPGSYAIRRDEGGKKENSWHKLGVSMAKAEELLTEWYGGLPTRRVQGAIRTREARLKRGLPTE